MLDGALHLIIYTMKISGDGAIDAQAGGHVFRWLQGGIAVTVLNADNHQTTWGVLRAAIAAVTECMFNSLSEGAANFRVVDGGNVIGTRYHRIDRYGRGERVKRTEQDLLSLVSPVSAQ